MHLSFSAILIDIDNFKKINDVYGHDVGDEALQITAELIRNSLRSNDFIARFGGDEFYMILATSNMTKLKAIIDRISDSVNEFNMRSSKPYKISFSMGYDVYDYKSALNYEDFLKHINLLMYDDKSKRHLA